MTNGVEDPWKHASVLKRKDDLIVYELDCNNCAHCVELYTPKEEDAPVLKKARKEITHYFDRWIFKHWKSLE